MKPKGTYGAMKVTENEYQAARKAAKDGDAGAYQVCRYCEGGIFIRDDAVAFLQTLRTKAG